MRHDRKERCCTTGACVSSSASSSHAAATLAAPGITVGRCFPSESAAAGLTGDTLAVTYRTLWVLYTRIGSDSGNPQSAIMYCIQNIHTHSTLWVHTAMEAAGSPQQECTPQYSRKHTHTHAVVLCAHALCASDSACALQHHCELQH